VMVGDRGIGVTTSGGFGHSTGKSLGFAYVEPAYSAPGAEFDVLLIGKAYRARVLADPVWDPANARLRA
jgi:dimethylglycine dehydrogenase